MAVDCRVQGADAERSIVAGLRALVAHRVDVIALVRGGGARTDLATFDGALVAREIAATAVPVITGIGHEVDTSVADQVAHTACKTPTACAAHLVARARSFHDRADELWAEIGQQAAHRLEVESRLLATQGGAAARVGHAAVVAADQLVAECGRRLALGAGRATELATLRLASVDARVSALDPRRALERGWSITRREDGTLVRSSVALDPGTELVTQFADGSVHSVVTGPPPSTASAPPPNRPSDPNDASRGPRP